MRRAGSATLARIQPLLEDLRSRTVLREARPGIFTLQSRAFIHFHDDDAGIFADVRLADAFVRMPVTSRLEQADLLERVDECLSTVESGETERRRHRRRKNRSGGAA